MTVRIMVVGDSDLHDDIYELWEARFEGNDSQGVHPPEAVAYLERAEDRLKRLEFTVVFVGQRARLNKHEKGEPHLQATVEWLGGLRKRHRRSRVVLCVDAPSTEQMLQLEAVGLVSVGSSNLQMRREHILLQIKEGIRAAANVYEGIRASANVCAAPSGLEVIAEFRFHVPDPVLQLHYFHNGSPLSGASIRIHGSSGLMQRFLESSFEVDRLAKEPPDKDTPRKLQDAMMELDRVGSEIIKHDEVIKEYNKLVALPSANHVRICITTSEERYPCLFEALRIGAQARPCVVEHPTSRSVHFGQDPRVQLKWSHNDPVKILVVSADMGKKPVTIYGSESALSVSFRPLPYAREEAEFFNRLWQAYNDHMPFDPENGMPGEPVKIAIGKVTFLRYEQGKPSLSHRLKEALSRHEYDILHFIGHAYGHRLPNDTIDTRLVLPTGDPSAGEALTLFQLTSWLQKARVQFVYLSCCSGIPTKGGAGMALTSAAVAKLFKSIPFTLGFRWDVLDRRAFEFAKDFYTELFVHDRQLDEAMQKARRNLFDSESGTDSMWASPVLLLQGPFHAENQRG